MAAGSHNGAPVTIQDVWEAVGAHEGGRIDDEELEQLERDACPGFGACTGHFTANTMAVAIDFLGLGPIGLGERPATDPAKGDAAAGGRALVLDLIARDVRPSALVTRAALQNAIVGVTGTGGSTNGVLHLLAIANEAGVELALEDFDRISASTPVVDEPDAGRPLRRRRPASRRRNRRGDQAAARPPGRRSADGRRPNARRARRRSAPSPTGEVMAASPTPFKPGGALRVLRGNLAPDGAVVKLAGHERPVHHGPARVFDSEADCKAAVYDGLVQPGEVVVVRGEGPAGAPGHAGDALDHLGDRRSRSRRLGRPRHRRALQRRDARLDGRPRRARGGAWRADRAASATATR